jgi:putative two-component system response regulator
MSKQPILIVDDEPQNLAAMRQILESEYSLVYARSGEDALVAVQKHHPALILLDIHMPGMNGYEVCRKLKADPNSEGIPVIFVTALTGVGNEEEGLKCGAVDYITKPVSPPIVRARVKIHLSLVRASDLEQSRRDAVYMLGEAGHFYDDNTGTHIWRMAAYAAVLARACGWDEDMVDQMTLAAPMHDTGKIGIPSTILRKPGKLDADEWVIMKTHTTIGCNILSKSEAPLFKLAASIALNHHERWDGSGYPHGLKGKDIPESARIVAVADVFDALTMKRPYKEAWSVPDALEQIRKDAGTHFDPEIIAHFETVLPEIYETKDFWEKLAK